MLYKVSIIINYLGRVHMRSFFKSFLVSFIIITIGVIIYIIMSGHASNYKPERR